MRLNVRVNGVDTDCPTEQWLAAIALALSDRDEMIGTAQVLHEPDGQTMRVWWPSGESRTETVGAWVAWLLSRLDMSERVSAMQGVQRIPITRTRGADRIVTIETTHPLDITVRLPGEVLPATGRLEHWVIGALKALPGTMLTRVLQTIRGGLGYDTPGRHILHVDMPTYN